LFFQCAPPFLSLLLFLLLPLCILYHALPFCRYCLISSTSSSSCRQRSLRFSSRLSSAVCGNAAICSRICCFFSISFCRYSSSTGSLFANRQLPYWYVKASGYCSVSPS